MTRMICNSCRKEEPPTNSLPPVGWFSTWRRGSGESDVHFCSPACGVTYFRTLETDEARAAAHAHDQDTALATDDVGLRLQ